MSQFLRLDAITTDATDSSPDSVYKSEQFVKKYQHLEGVEGSTDLKESYGG